MMNLSRYKIFFLLTIINSKKNKILYLNAETKEVKETGLNQCIE